VENQVWNSEERILDELKIIRKVHSDKFTVYLIYALIWSQKSELLRTKVENKISEVKNIDFSGVLHKANIIAKMTNKIDYRMAH
jgi:hypothetical protein